MADALHRELIEEHGGAHGIRDDGLVDSALARPRNRFGYEGASDLADLAAAYGYGLTRNHGYVDGNKRVGLAAMLVFLSINRHTLDATEVDEVKVMLQVAEGAITEEELAEWVRSHLVAI